MASRRSARRRSRRSDEAVRGGAASAAKPPRRGTAHPRKLRRPPLDPEALLNLTFSRRTRVGRSRPCRRHDPLDAADATRVARMNAKFPTEESLGIDAFCDELDGAPRRSTRRSCKPCARRRRRLVGAERTSRTASSRWRSASSRCARSKGKAERREQMVHEICRDIKSLDYAKRHLTTTITALKRLQMLVTAVEQLVVMSRARMYAEAANLLAAVDAAPRPLCRVHAHRQGARAERQGRRRAHDRCARQVFDDFNKLSAEDGTPQIGGAAFETLDRRVRRRDARGRRCARRCRVDANWRFAPYKHTRPYFECGSLEKTELRYAWFRKLLQAYDDTFAPLFPASGTSPSA